MKRFKPRRKTIFISQICASRVCNRKVQKSLIAELDGSINGVGVTVATAVTVIILHCRGVEGGGWRTKKKGLRPPRCRGFRFLETRVVVRWESAAPRRTIRPPPPPTGRLPPTTRALSFDWQPSRTTTTTTRGRKKSHVLFTFSFSDVRLSHSLLATRPVRNVVGFVQKAYNDVPYTAVVYYTLRKPWRNNNNN